MISRLTLAGLVVLGGPALAQQPVEQGRPNVPDFSPAFEGQTRAPELLSDVTLAADTVAEGLKNPWGIALLPDGAMLVTERPGRLRVVAADGTLSEPVAGVPEVLAEGQGGLLDVAIDPDFAANRLVYLTYAKPLAGALSATAAARGVLSEDMSALSDVEDIFVQEPPSPTTNHYGSRIVFDGAGHAFVTTGEHFTETERRLSQDLGSTYGKVMRIGLDGSIPDDNPFVGQEGAIASIWSYGHRNVQGAAMRPGTGELWTIEHGPQGGDELNLTLAGTNYGWPVISYGENYNGSAVGEAMTQAEGMAQPNYYWDPVIAPGGMAFYEGDLIPEWQGDLFIAGLQAGGVVRLEIDGDRVVGEERLATDLGRVRDVEIAPDGSLLVLTGTGGEVVRLSPEAD